MTIAVTAPLLVCIVGGLLFAFGGGKLSEAGRIAFFCGLFWLVYLLKSLHL